MDSLLRQTRGILLDGGRIEAETALALDRCDKSALYQLANEIRLRFMGPGFELCSIINAKSGNCSENCRFCAQSAWHHTGAQSYAIIEAQQALMIACDNDSHGVERLSLVTSGRSLASNTIEELERLYAQMRQKTSLLFCASTGMLDDTQAQRLRAAGVSRYHCNLESSRSYFPQVCTSHSWEEKAATLQCARRNGLSLCSGGIIGMGESLGDRVALAIELRQLGVKSIPINILTPIEGTPLADLPELSLDEILTCIALFRLINPLAVIRMAGGRQQLGAAQYRCFEAGANGAIVGNFLTTGGAGIAQDLQQLGAMGFTFARRAAHD